MVHAVMPVSFLQSPRGVLVAALALVASLGLLATIGRVAREAVRQGELRHEATAQHSTATWRCNRLRSMRQRDDCLAELNAPPAPGVRQ